jgi:ABC-2 type transport system ATP-binding protein
MNSTSARDQINPTAREQREAGEPILSSQPLTAIRVERLTKTYGDRAAVADVSFDVRAGSIFAILGPNGAGKTTTVEILEGYRRRDGGSVRVLDLDPATDAARLRHRVGVMPQQGGVYPQLRPLEALRLFASFYRRPRDPEELIREVGLDDALDQRYRYLSGGQQQRLSLALTLIGRPDLVFLDEPTTGMDPRARRSTWETIRGLKADGVTVVITTHLMDEAEQLADDVLIINHGRVVVRGTPDSLMAATGGALVRFRTSAALDLPRLQSRLGLPIRPTGQQGYVLEEQPSPALISALTKALEDQNVLLSELRVGNPSLEDAFLELTRSAAADTE